MSYRTIVVCLFLGEKMPLIKFIQFTSLLLVLTSLTITTLGYSKENQEIDKKSENWIHSIIRQMSSDEKPLGVGFELDPLKANERLTKLQRMDKWKFRAKTGLHIGLGALVIYWKRKALSKMVQATIKASATLGKGFAPKILSAAKWILATRYIIPLVLFWEIVSHASEAGDITDTTCGYYAEHLNEFFFELSEEERIYMLTVPTDVEPEPTQLLLIERVCEIDAFYQTAIQEMKLRNELNKINKDNGFESEDDQLFTF